jgi:hypothetical protein
VIDCVVAPVDQTLPVAAEDVRVIEDPAQTDAGPVIVGTTAAGLAVTTFAADVAAQPAALVTVTVNVPAAETVIDCVVAPVDQRLPVAADEVSVIEAPGQNEAAPVIVGVAGAALAVTANAAEVAEQPAAVVTVTVKEPAAETVIDCVVAPVDHTLPVAEDEVRVIVLPGQTVVAPVIVGVGGNGLAATTKAADVALQPLALVTVTVKEPAAATVMDCVVAPVDQRFPVAADEVNVTARPAQMEAGPLMVGVAGRGLETTENAADVAEQPPALVAVTL